MFMWIHTLERGAAGLNCNWTDVGIISFLHALQSFVLGALERPQNANDVF